MDQETARIGQSLVARDQALVQQATEVHLMQQTCKAEQFQFRQAMSEVKAQQSHLNVEREQLLASSGLMTQTMTVPPSTLPTIVEATPHVVPLQPLVAAPLVTGAGVSSSFNPLVAPAPSGGERISLLSFGPPPGGQKPDPPGDVVMAAGCTAKEKKVKKEKEEKKETNYKKGAERLS